jgi:hypothetical protein
MTTLAMQIVTFVELQELLPLTFMIMLVIPHVTYVAKQEKLPTHGHLQPAQLPRHVAYAVQPKAKLSVT